MSILNKLGSTRSRVPIPMKRFHARPLRNKGRGAGLLPGCPCLRSPWSAALHIGYPLWVIPRHVRATTDVQKRPLSDLCGRDSPENHPSKTEEGCREG